MFLKEFDKFKLNVEKAIKGFFGLSPEDSIELEKYTKDLLSKYGNVDELTFDKVTAEDKDTLCKYESLKYFNSIYKKLLELEDVLKREIY